jgi:hypothetical protein
MYPLLCNDRKLTPTEILLAHKGQPKIEKRFEILCFLSSVAVSANFDLAAADAQSITAPSWTSDLFDVTRVCKL